MVFGMSASHLNDSNNPSFPKGSMYRWFQCGLIAGEVPEALTDDGSQFCKKDCVTADPTTHSADILTLNVVVN